jgi:hypothetical protein
MEEIRVASSTLTLDEFLSTNLLIIFSQNSGKKKSPELIA